MDFEEYMLLQRLKSEAEENWNGRRRRERQQNRMKKIERNTEAQKTVLCILLMVLSVVMLMWLLTTQAESETVVDENAPVVLVIEEAIEEETLNLAAMNRIENAKVTAYCTCEKCCGVWADGITASGRPAEAHVSVAVDTKMIPLGSTIYVDYGDGEIQQYRADDTGSAVVGAHIDVCYPDHESALEHGVKTAKVYWEVE